METTTTPCPARESVNRLSSRLANEKREQVLFLIELAEFDRKKLGLELGYPSTFACLVEELRMSPSAACRRIAAARMLARFPAISPYLLDSRLNLSTLVPLKDVLDETNLTAVLDRAAGLGEIEVRALVTSLQTETPDTTGPVATSDPTPDTDLSTLTLWVGREFREELAAVKDLLSHAVTTGKKEDVLLYVLREARKLHERRRYGSPRRPAPLSPESLSSSGRHVPAPVRREVFERDGGKCAYVGAEGKRCDATAKIEFHHIDPYGWGGPPLATNLKLYCQPHNLLQAEKDYGADYIAQRKAEARAPADVTATAPARPVGARARRRLAGPERRRGRAVASCRSPST